MSLEAGIGANSAAPTSSQTEMEELLDWMRNDEGQSASIAPQPVGERSEDQAMPAEESAADDEVDADGKKVIAKSAQERSQALSGEASSAPR